MQIRNPTRNIRSILRIGIHKSPLLRATLFLGFLFWTLQSFGQAPVANFTANLTSGCAPVIVNFQSTSTGNPTSYFWEFGNGNTSTMANPIATYLNPGNYTVKLTVTNASGSNSLTRTQYINVYTSPTVGFRSNVQNGCTPLTIQFTDTSIAAAGTVNTAWSWDFGNGQTSTQQNPLITFTTVGTYTVSLKVTNDQGCSRTISRPNYITVTTGVDASFTNSSPSVCSAPAAINFTNTSTGPGTLSYNWLFGDGGTSNATNPTHTFNTNGTYTVTLITTSSAGCVDTFRSAPLTIGGIITQFNAPNEVCIGSAATFTNTSTPAPVASLWNFGDGNTSTAINPTHNYTATGAYLIKLYNTYSNCTDSSVRILFVRPKPTANFTAPVRTKCEPSLLVNFQDLSTGNPVSWEWDFGDGNSSNLQNPTHSYSNYGSFTVRLIITSQFGCKDTITRPNYINIRRAQIQLTGLPAQGCLPFPKNFSATINSIDNILTYQWDLGDGTLSNLPNPTHTYTTQGTYDVQLIITTSTGCKDTLKVTQAIKVGTVPVVNFSASPIPVCGTQPVQFTDLTTPQADQWIWTFGDGTGSNLKNPSHRYTDTGFFTIRLTAYNNGCDVTTTKINYVKVLPAIARFTPVPNCTNRLSFSFTNQSIDATSSEWDFGDGSPVSTASNPTHIFPALGPYTIRLIAKNGTCADTIYKNIRLIDENPVIAANQTTLCKIGTVRFYSTQVNTALINNYSWNFGNGQTGTTAIDSIQHTYTTNGLYTIQLVTTDLNGCKDTAIANNYIRVNGPTARFSALDTAGCKGFTTTFIDQSSTYNNHAITQWQWHYGDGSVQNYTNPPFQHTYNTVGDFAVKLVITDAYGCKDSITKPNQIHSTDPVPSFATADTLSCPGATVRFTNNSSPAGLTYAWTFGDGNTSILSQPTHTYVASGRYNVKLVVKDIYGCADSLIRNQYIRIDTPIAAFTKNLSSSSCTPFQVQFTNTSTYFNQSHWSFGPGEGTSSQTNPVYFFNNVGTFPVKLIVTSPGGCTDSVEQIIRVYDTIGTRLIYPPATACKPYTTQLSVQTNGPMQNYFWDLGDGTTLTSTPTYQHTYNNMGDFYPSVIAIDSAGCRIPVMGAERIHIRGVDANFGSNLSFLCDGGQIRFSDSTISNNAPLQYQWQFGDGGTSTLPNPTHTYTAAGNYTVQMIVSSQNACRDTITKSNLIKIVERPHIRVTGPTQACIFSSLQHTGSFIVPDTSAVNWQWNFPNGGSANSINPGAQTYNTSGSFQIQIIATNSSGCKDTVNHPLRIDPLPTINVPLQMTVRNGFPVTIPATYSPNVNQWSWSPPAGLSCTQCPRPDVSPRDDTRYLVQVQDANGCRNQAQVMVLVFCQESNVFFPNTFSPNGDGSNDIYYPRGRGLDRIKSLQIMNRWGQIVFQKQHFPANDPTQGWDGKYLGQSPQAETYIYTAEVFCENGTLLTLTGNIALIR
ncbi:MAG: hypothetical protein RLZZ256_756 [Bacteroidota bacterium]